MRKHCKGPRVVDRYLYDRGLTTRRQVLGDAYVDHALAKVENIEHELAAERRNFLRFFTLLENQPQFFLAVCQLRARYWFHAQHFVQQKIGRLV